MVARITRVSELGLDLICHYTPFVPVATLSSSGVWKIGYGTARYPQSRRVHRGDRCSPDQARAWLADGLAPIERWVDEITRDDLKQHEFDALVSFCHHHGPQALDGSKLNKLVNMRNQDAERFHKYFGVWNKERVNGRLVELNGAARRSAEAHLYITGELKFFA